jgi:hypothetical protein
MSDEVGGQRPDQHSHPEGESGKVRDLDGSRPESIGHDVVSGTMLVAPAIEWDLHCCDPIRDNALAVAQWRSP